jgi:hypothetical protein
VLRRRLAGVVARVGRFDFSMATRVAALALEGRKRNGGGDAQERDKLMCVGPIPPLSSPGRVAHARPGGWSRAILRGKASVFLLVIFHLTSPCFSQTRWHWLPAQAKLRQATSLPRMQGSSHDCFIARPPTPLESLPGSPSAHQGTAVLCYFLGTWKPTSSSRTC